MDVPADFLSGCDIIDAEEKEAAAKPTFTFPAALTSKCPMKSDVECVSADLRV